MSQKSSSCKTCKLLLLLLYGNSKQDTPLSMLLLAPTAFDAMGYSRRWCCESWALPSSLLTVLWFLEVFQSSWPVVMWVNTHKAGQWLWGSWFTNSDGQCYEIWVSALQTVCRYQLLHHQSWSTNDLTTTGCNLNDLILRQAAVKHCGRLVNLIKLRAEYLLSLLLQAAVFDLNANFNLNKIYQYTFCISPTEINEATFGQRV